MLTTVEVLGKVVRKLKIVVCAIALQLLSARVLQ